MKFLPTAFYLHATIILVALDSIISKQLTIYGSLLMIVALIGVYAVEYLSHKKINCEDRELLLIMKADILKLSSKVEQLETIAALFKAKKG